MARPSDKEFKLFRKIKELEEQNKKKDLEIEQLKKKLDKLETKEFKPVKGKKQEKGCPTCGSSIKTTDLPFGKLYICSEGCGWREVKHS